MLNCRLSVFAIGVVMVTIQSVQIDDYPTGCKSVCDPVASRSDTCDNRFDDDDQGQLNCVCNGSNMINLIPRCLGCVSPYQNDEGYDYNDIDQLLQACGLTALPASSGALTGAAVVPSSKVYTTTFTSTDDDGDVEMETEEVTSVFGAAAPRMTVFTTTFTSTDDDGDVETETEEVTSTVSPAASARVNTTVFTTRTSGGKIVITSTASPTGATNQNNGGSSPTNNGGSSSSQGAGVTAAPRIVAGAGVMAVAALAAF